MKNQNTTYYKIGENKGNKRIWLQGGNLTLANFEKGDHYEKLIDVDNQSITLKKIADPSDTSFVVSGRKQKNGVITPIIDITNSSLLNVTKNATRVRADFFMGDIHITIHHLDTRTESREVRFKNRIKNGGLTKGVLCSGIGVSLASISDGFSDSGIPVKTEFVVDRERKYLEVLARNNHAISNKTKFIEASIEELEPALIPSVDLLSFSLPCTGHSPSGKSKNNNTYAEEHLDSVSVLGLMRVIDASNPALLISENVVQAKDSATYILLKSMLAVCGYTISEAIIDSQATNSLENRKRYWFCAVSNGLSKVNLEELPSVNTAPYSLEDIMEDVPLSSPMWKSTKSKIAKQQINKAKGNRFNFNLIEDFSTTKIGVIGRHYCKDRATEPHISGGNGLMRLLTVNEVAKAQQVPLHLIENTISTTAYEGLGQGIDYKQGYLVSLAICRDLAPKAA